MSDEKKDLGDKAEDALDNAKKKAKDLGGKAEDAFDKAKDKAERMEDKAEEAFDDAKQKAKEFGNKAEDAFDGAKEKAADFADDAKEKASEYANEAKKSANEFTENAKEAFSNVGGENKKLMAGILAIVLGSLGIHKFILGYQKEGIIMLVCTLVIGFFTCGIGASVMGIIGLIEGIIYLTKTDEEFYNTYQVGRKPWF